MASGAVVVPVYLQPGYVLVYGGGNPTGIQEITTDNVNMVFGLINKVWNYGNINAQIGDSVMWNKNDAACVLTYDNFRYTLIEQARLVLTEIPPIPPS